MIRIFFVILFCLFGFVPKSFAFSDVPHIVPWDDPVHSITLTDYIQYYDTGGIEWVIYCQNNAGTTSYITNNATYGYTAPYWISLTAPTCVSGYTIGFRNYGNYWDYCTGAGWPDFLLPLPGSVRTTADYKSASEFTFPASGSAYGLTGTIANGQILATAGTNISYSLTVARSPEAGGGVASLSGEETEPNCEAVDGLLCGVCGYNYCAGSVPYNSIVKFGAFPNSGYAFDHWSWNGGANTATDNSHTFTMSGALGVTGVFYPILKFPLTGTLEQRGTPLLSFGDTWTFGECPSGIYKKHTGVDLQATSGEEVYAAHAGTIKEIFTGEHSQWADAIVVESTDSQYTTVYWHVIKYGSLAVNDTVTKGQQIATVADLDSNTHFHFGIRMSGYDANFSLAGSLPQSACGSNPTYPAFPEYFINPSILTFE